MSHGLDADRIATALLSRLRRPDAAEWTGRISVLASTGSTNDDARRWAQEGVPHGSAVFAEEQQDGRGRKNGRWCAPAGKNLTFSAVLRPDLSTEFWPRMAHAAALAVSRAIDSWLAPVRVEVKWPNDLMVAGRKLGGILVEASLARSNPFLVVGIGLNVNSAPGEFATEGLECRVASVWDRNGGREADRNEMAGAILAELLEQSQRCGAEFASVLDELRERSWLLGKQVCVWERGSLFRGEAIGFGGNGELQLRVSGEAGGGGEVREVVTADLVRLASEELEFPREHGNSMAKET